MYDDPPRPDFMDSGEPIPRDFNLRQLQDEVKRWSQYNFRERSTDQNAFEGMAEELGELAHARLKARQGIRTSEDHWRTECDAVGDLVIYIANYCGCRGIDLHSIVEATWEKVRRRDWTKNTVDGSV